MSSDIDDNVDEKPLSQFDTLVLPPWYKRVFGLMSGLVSLICGGLYVAYIASPQNIPSPSDLQLGSVFIFSSAIFLLLTTPWAELGLRINKIGPIEFERVINAQNREHIEEISELRQLLNEVDAKVRGLDDISSVSENMARPLVTDFLRQNSPTAYSPLRIQQWGAKQSGFEKLSNYSLSNVRKVLQDMAAEGLLETAVSKLGNTLYRIAG
jgi:hypothetical protein